QTRVETDITKLVPQSLSSLQNLEQLERATGVGGEIDLIVSGNSVASPATIEWMSAYQSTVLRRFGYTATRGCGVARLCPAFSLAAGRLSVALVLLVLFRGERRRALVPLVPIALATGWSALVLFAVRVPLNPMSVTLGALVIAISTEFSVLLSERYRQERLAGHPPSEALRRGYRRTGAAVLASGATAIMGFGVLALSDIRMLRDFGLVTLIDL